MSALKAPGFLHRLPVKAIAAIGSLTFAGGTYQAALFATTVMVARMLGRADLGRYAVSLAIGTVIVSGVGGGLPVFALREVAAHGADRRFVRNLLRTALTATGIATVAAATVGLLLLKGFSGFALGGLAGVCNVVLSLVAAVNAVHSGLLNFRAVVIGQVAGACALVLATFGALHAGWGLPGAIASLGITQLITLSWLLWSLRGRLSDHAVVEPSGLFARSRALMGVGLFYGGYQRIDSLVILAVTSSATAGVYTAAYRLLGPFSLAAGGFGTVFFARLAAVAPGSQDWDRLRRKGANLLALAVAPVALIMLILMPTIVRTLYGSEFMSAVLPARILILSLVPSTLYLPSAHAMNAARRERALFTVMAGSILLQIPLMMVLASRYGATGAAIAWLLTETVALAGISLARKGILFTPAS